MKLSDWARKEGITYKTAWLWWKAGTLPVKATQMASGTILVEEQTKPRNETAAVYARVSSSDQKGDLDGQVARVVRALNDKNIPVVKTVVEIGSGLNGHRPKLISLLSDSTITVIAVEHRDRLMRFGVEYVEAALASTQRRLVVIEEDEVTDDLDSDMIEVLTSFCARLYGRRSARNRAKKAMAAAAEVMG